MANAKWIVRLIALHHYCWDIELEISRGAISNLREASQPGEASR
jgi:hypothetical protein